MIIERKSRSGRPPLSQETKDLVVRLYNEDKMTCKEIAKACQISEASLHRIIRERRMAENGKTKE